MKGKIVLVSFPYTNLTEGIIRPAVILMERELDVTVAFITSQLKWQMPFDVLLEPSSINGLKLNSLIRLTKLATISKQLVLGELGDLSSPQTELLNSHLITLLKLNS